MSASFAELETAGVLSSLDVELARTLSRVSGERDEEVLLAAALASREVQAGHVCADLARLAGQGMAEDGSFPHTWPALQPWIARLESSRLVRRPEGNDAAEPLVLDDKNRLYLARYYDHERSVARRLRELASERVKAPALDEELVHRLFPPRADGQQDLQRKAALDARTRRLSVIVGGPGTGKTSTIVKLLALWIQDALARGAPPPRTLLVAPTGKAAQRLTESIERARDSLPVDDAIKRAIESNARTVHRALGALPDSLTRFRHHREHPLECDLLLLDEASMVDLALMRRLLDAVPQHARVVMLGDPDQLASVEAGGVLGDMCEAAENPQSPLAACLSRLTQSYRYREASGIAQLARAVHAQRLDDVMSILRGAHDDVALRPSPPIKGLGRALEQEAKSGYRGLCEQDLEQRLSTLDRFRVLCAHRKGPASVEQLNPSLSQAVRGRQLLRGESYPGRPILITENDYGTDLFNGDVGVLHAERSQRELSACFRTGSGGVRKVGLARLPSHESVYAMTVHKSQGSEFDRVAIVLPDRPSPVLSRELLFTAITRAREAVTIYASEVSLRATLARRVVRSSGLVDRLLTG